MTSEEKREANRRYQQAATEKIRARKAGYYQQRRAELLEYQAAYHAANKDRKRAYYLENREQILRDAHDRYMRNREARRAYDRAYYVRKKAEREAVASGPSRDD